VKIHCEAYEPLAEYVYNEENVGKPLPPGTKSVFCHCDNVAQLFKENAGADPYVLISAQSDFGPRYQEEHPVWADMEKWLHFLPPYITPELGYKGFDIPPRCRLDSCRPEDKYSIKCYSFTRSTFPAIPDNVVRWFCTNSEIAETTYIPFGTEKENLHLLTPRKEKSKFCYYNCKAYTYERAQLWQLCRQTNYITVKQDVSHQEFMDDLASHSLIVCPPSNGIDSYRIWQALYSGSVPVVQRSRLTENLRHLPIAIADNLFAAVRDFDWLVEQAEVQYPKFDQQLGWLDLDFWRAEIEAAVHSL